MKDAVWGRALTIKDDLVAAWRFAAVKRGVLGTCLLFAGSLTPAYLPQNSPWWTPMRDLGLDNQVTSAFGTAMVVAGAVIIIEAWFRLRAVVWTKIKHWAVGVWWTIPLLLAPPIFSHDAYAYAAEGWLLRNGLSPYDNPISVLPGPFADQAAWVWRYTTAMYPALSLRIFEGMVVVGGQNPYYSTLALRIPALLGVAMIAYFLPRIARRRGVDVAFTAWFATINPLLLIDFVGGLHNDALMMGLVVLSLWLVICSKRRGWGVMIAAAAILGVAASVKQPALLAAFAVALVGHPWASWRLPDTLRALSRLLVSFAVTIGSFVAVSLACGLGFGWVHAMNVPGMLVTLAPFALLGAGVRELLLLAGQAQAGDLAQNAIRMAGLGLSALVIAWQALTFGRRRPVAFVSRAYLVFAFGGIALYSWYLTWGGLLLPLARPSERTVNVAVGLTSVLLVYEAGNLAWRNNSVGLGFAGLGVLGALIWYHMIRRGPVPERIA